MSAESSLWTSTVGRVVLVVVASVVATASRFVAGLILSPLWAGIAGFCAAWITLYPLARLNRAVPAWAHWARGAFILIILWLVTLVAR